MEQRILVEKKKEGKQLYNYLKMEDKHQPNKKTIEANFIDPKTAYEDSLSKPALDRLKRTGTTNTLRLCTIQLSDDSILKKNQKKDLTLPRNLSDWITRLRKTYTNY